VLVWAAWYSIVDLRVGSPSFQRWQTVQLDDEDYRALLISDGLGHAYSTNLHPAELADGEFRPVNLAYVPGHLSAR
jgi:dTDP-4-dehydrorhamnose 3,5-epimerase-like enzyme